MSCLRKHLWYGTIGARTVWVLKCAHECGPLIIARHSNANRGTSSSSNPLYDSTSNVNRPPKKRQSVRASKAYLKTLVEKFKSHAINAISSTDARPFWRWQIKSWPFLLVSHTPPEPWSPSNARLKFAELKTMKIRSRKISRSFDRALWTVKVR